MLLRNATLADGSRVDVRLARGEIREVARGGELAVGEGDETLNLSRYMLLPALAEPHTHLDKALTADRFGQQFTTLPAAIAAWHAYRETLAVDDMVERARRAALLALAYGATAVRTHADVGRGIGLRAVEALLRVRDELRPLVDIQVVVLAYPLTGDDGKENRSLLREALRLGADVVGGAPHVDPDPAGQVEICLDMATEFGRPVDLHADENMRTSSVDLTELVRQVGDGFPPGATASHCVSLGIQPAQVQAEVAAAAAAAGVSIVTLPIANLYLQGRDQATATPRGLTALPALLAAGVVVAGGGDNLQDPFIPVGRADPLLTAQYLVIGGQLPPSKAYELVGSKAREVMGLPPLAVGPGFPADLVAVAGSSLREAIANASEDRLVFRRGRLVSRTRVFEDEQLPSHTAQLQ
jgi:cytosine/creatinine deaminase